MRERFSDHLLDTAAAALAVVAAVLPGRYWRHLPSLPIARMALLAALITMFTGVGVGVDGYLDYLDQTRSFTDTALVRIAEAQLAGRLPANPTINLGPMAISMMTPLAFALTPLGLIAIYLTVSGLARAVATYVEEPAGDPILGAIDAVVRRVWRRGRDTHARRAREREEGADVPDRLYAGEWAGLSGVDFVVVAARRKREWDQGTFVITPDKWYRLGAPFDLRLEGGLRTVYPLTEITTNDVLRRGVPYELPPLSRARARRR